MKALCIDCSNTKAHINVINDDNILSLNVDSPHSENLMPAVDKLLLQAKLSVLDLDTLAVVVGPGSFTGIRIAVSTIKGIAVVNTKAKLVSVTNFDLVDSTVNSNLDHAVVIDSNNQDKYVGIYKNGKLCNILSLSLSGILALNMPVFATESQKEALSNINANFVAQLDTQLAQVVQKKVSCKQFVPISELKPLYVKKSQAERTRSEKILAELEIEPAHEVEALLQVENECFDQPWSKQLFKQELDQHNKFYFVAKHNGKVVAYIGFETDLFDMNLQKLAVIPDYRDLGIATKLLELSLEKKQILQKEKYFLEVDVNNSPAISLYKKMGFEIINTRPNYYKNGDSCYVMQYVKDDE